MSGACVHGDAGFSMPTETHESASALSNAPAARAASQRSAAPSGPEKAASVTFNTARTFGDGRGLGDGNPTLDDVDVDEADFEAVLVARGACEKPATVPFVYVGHGEAVLSGFNERVGSSGDFDAFQEREGIEEWDTDSVTVSVAVHGEGIATPDANGTHARRVSSMLPEAGGRGASGKCTNQMHGAVHAVP